MMKRTVHNKRALLGNLERLIEAALGLPLGTRPWEVSDVKQDGSVFIRFKSSRDEAAIFLAERFRDVLSSQGYQFTQTDDAKFRFPLTQFPSSSV